MVRQNFPNVQMKEELEKMREWHKNHPITLEGRERRRKTWLGRNHTEETKKIISEKTTGKKRTEELDGQKSSERRLCQSVDGSNTPSHCQRVP